MHVYCNHCGLSSALDAQFCQRCGTRLQPNPVESRPVLPLTAKRFAGFWIRVVASIVDFLVLFAAIYPIRLLLGSAVTIITIDSQLSTHEVFLARRWARITIAIVLGYAYRIGLESSSYQATLGKMATRLKVTDLQGNRVSFARATARTFCKYLSILSLGLGYVMVAFDEEKQALHDRIAGTLVEYRQRRLEPMTQDQFS